MDVPGVSCGLFAAEVLDEFKEAHFACCPARFGIVGFQWVCRGLVRCNVLLMLYLMVVMHSRVLLICSKWDI